jgi:hypothetical protein
MSSLLPSAPRRGAQRVSHLRQVSNGSSEAGTAFASRPVTSNSSTGTIHHDPTPLKMPVERRCNLWVHDEVFSKEDVVLNLDLFPNVKVGELMAIVALKAESGIRDFQEKAPKKDFDGLSSSAHLERSVWSQFGRAQRLKNTTHDSGLGRRYLFLVRDMPKELKHKHPALEVSVAKHIADVFNLKHRSNVLLSTVSLNLFVLRANG